MTYLLRNSKIEYFERMLLARPLRVGLVMPERGEDLISQFVFDLHCEEENTVNASIRSCLRSDSCEKQP